MYSPHMARERITDPAIADTPDFDGFVTTGRNQHILMQTKGHIVNIPKVVRESTDFCSRLKIPELNGAILTPTGPKTDYP